jgi:hypothetical protein
VAHSLHDCEVKVNPLQVAGPLRALPSGHVCQQVEFPCAAITPQLPIPPFNAGRATAVQD